MTANAESTLVVLTAALDYIARGWSPISIPHREKGPLIDAWQDMRVNAGTAAGYFNGAKQNVGIILGKASGGLTDLDLDCPEAIAAAPYILPRTAVFGRATKPASHWVYRTNLHETKDRAAIKFMGSDKSGLLEVRMGAGGLASQTVFPPSTHVSGEPIEWAGRGASEIAEVDGDELIQRARRLAAASELARSYPRIGGRHDAAFVLGSFLARCGFSQPGAATFVEAVAAASLQPGDKRRDMARTARDGAVAGKLAGFPLLAETFGEKAAKKVADWLDYAGEREGRGARAEATTATSASWGDAEREIAARLAEGDSAGFLARARTDAGFPFEPNAIAALNQLAKRRAPDFERLRTQLKAETKVRFAALEAAMKAEAAIGDSGDDGKQGRAIDFPEPEPWPTPVAGAPLLDDIVGALGRHVIMSAHQRVAAALWVVHTYLLNRLMISPRLAIRSVVKGSGKTTLLDVLARLVLRPLLAASVSPSAIFRVVAAHAPTLLIDEADTLFHEGDDTLRGVLNAGHRRGGVVLRSVGDDFEPRAFSCYAATVIALIGQLPGTLADRAVDIVLARRRPSEEIAPFRLDQTDHLDALARRIARWAKDNGERLGRDPAMPPGLHNRAADNWRPLLAIAEAVSGQWPETARTAAAAMTGGDIDEVSRTELLLSDIRDTFAALNDDEITSATLIEKLCGIIPRPWAEYGKSGKPITPNKLARLLKPLGVCPHLIGEHRLAGYRRARFDDAFERYLTPLSTPLPPLSNLSPSQTAGKPGDSDLFKPLTPTPPERFENLGLARNFYQMRDREVWKGGVGEEREPHAPGAAASISKKPVMPPNAIVTAARARGVAFVLATDGALFTLDWRGPHDPLIDKAIRDNYETILAWLIREAEGEP